MLPELREASTLGAAKTTERGQISLSSPIESFFQLLEHYSNYELR